MTKMKSTLMYRTILVIRKASGWFFLVLPSSFPFNKTLYLKEHCVPENTTWDNMFIDQRFHKNRNVVNAIVKTQSKTEYCITSDYLLMVGIISPIIAMATPGLVIRSTRISRHYRKLIIKYSSKIDNIMKKQFLFINVYFQFHLSILPSLD